MIGPQFAAGIAVLALLTISPGADMALVAKVTLERGRRAALWSTLGIATGTLVHGTASALGLSVILATSADAFTIVKIVGAGYLAYLGVQSLRRSFVIRDGAARREGFGGLASREDEALGAVAPRASRRPSLSQRFVPGSYLQGLLTNVLNPKVAVFYLTFLPQFIDPSRGVLGQSVLFALAHDVMGIAWLAAYAYAVARVARAFGGSGLRRWLERVTGAALIGLGVRLALERR